MITKKYKLNACIVTDTGRIREKNEDNFIFDGQINEQMESHIALQREIYVGQPVLFGVFDGMGGEAYGEHASFLMADTCRRYQLHANYPEEDAKALCCIGNERVIQEEEQRKASMGTTASMLFFGKDVLACNVGDSPIFLLRKGHLYPIYEEHTERSLYKQLNLGDVLNKKKKYRLLQNIGMEGKDITIQPYLRSIEWQDKDIFLICSDGLTDMVDEEEILNCLERCKENSASELLGMALQAGGRDNITVACIQISEEGQ